MSLQCLHAALAHSACQCSTSPTVVPWGPGLCLGDGRSRALGTTVCLFYVYSNLTLSVCVDGIVCLVFGLSPQSSSSPLLLWLCRVGAVVSLCFVCVSSPPWECIAALSNKPAWCTLPLSLICIRCGDWLARCCYTCSGEIVAGGTVPPNLIVCSIVGVES